VAEVEHLFYPPDVADEDLVQLRRSLAMAPSLPTDRITELLDEIERLRRDRRDLAGELEELAERLDQVRKRHAEG
jgi:uncharacterized protein YlxW (UPF0749 family)